ncbi:MAG TPA: ABC transporter ATP-binding protein [Acidimicrobiales bacterium]|nr:ABC transporter ATP-binding protein [Acidimicrobiales bacterium]
MISVEAVRKRYRPLVALDGVDFAVEAGEIVAVLGPNGAGKTTLIEIMEGFQRPDSGRVTVLGTDPYAEGPRLRERIGVMLQECEPEPYLSVTELLELYRGYYRKPRPVAELLDRVGLANKADARIRTLSGGQCRRLDLAVALVGNPELVFMDEPTTGFDPEARQAAWQVVKDLRDSGTTVVLTTHYLEEAEALADRVVVLAEGAVRAEGPPETIGSRNRAPTRVSFTPLESVSHEELPVAICVQDGRWVAITDSPTATLAILTSWAIERGVELESLSVTRPSLQDTYLELIR